MSEEGDMVQVTLYQRLKDLAAQPTEELHHAKPAQPARLLLFVHAAAHEEALRAISKAAADFDVGIHNR